MTVEQIVALEEGALNGWPALRTEAHGGWLWRFAGGYSKRANSVHPLYAPAPADLAGAIGAAEAAYRRADLPAVFKLPGHPAWHPLDTALASRGYEGLDPTRVLVRPLDQVSEPGRGFEDADFTDGWFEAFLRANRIAEPLWTSARAMAALVDLPLVAAVDDEGPVAWGYAALVGDTAWLYDIAVAPEARRRGHGRTLVQGLLARAKAAGAATAALQVVAANTAATGLYEGLGFTEAYRYHYRRKEQS